MTADDSNQRADDASLSHVGGDGEARMVDVGSKAATARRAVARAGVRMRTATRDAIVAGTTTKGAVLTVARIAAIQAAKRTGELIPLCHSLGLDWVDVSFRWHEHTGDAGIAGVAVLEIAVEACTTARTGVEMEAMTAAAIAALTVYDMVKAIDRGLAIEEVVLVEKDGGTSGRYRRDAAN